MNTFEQCMEFVFREEGAFVNDPRDPGGATNMGITLKTFRRQGAWGDLDGDGDVDENDLRLLTKKEALRVYQQEYWEFIQGDKWPKPLAFLLLDTAINCGPVNATVFMQQGLRIEADGVIGPKTIQAGKIMPLLTTIEETCARRAMHYATRATFRTFGLGWMRRLTRAQTEAIRMMEGL